MSRPTAPLATLALASLLAAFSPSSAAHACKCMFPPVESAKADAAAVFEGRVLAIREHTDPATMLGENRVTLAVVRTWKGLHRDEQIEIVTSNSGASCGYTFAKDASYLVYAQESEGKLSVSACSRTKPLAEARDDLKVLGAGATPVRVEPKGLPGDAAKGLAPDAGAVTRAAAVASLDAGMIVVDAGRPEADGGAPDAGVTTATPPPRSRARGGCAGSSAQAGLLGNWIAFVPAVAMVVRRRRRR